MPEASGGLSLGGGTAKKRTPRARVGRDKQEKVEKPQIISDRADELVALKMKADQASQAFSDAIKKAAEDSGLLSSVVRRFVIARAGESFEEKRRENVQLQLLFEEVGIVGRSSNQKQ